MKDLLMSVDETALDVFRSYHVSSGQMLCFNGPYLEKYRVSLRCLTAAGLLVKERFEGAYSLTDAGFTAMEKRSAQGRRKFV